MKRLLMAFVALLVMFGSLMCSPSVARAADDEPPITEYRATATVDESGTTSVRLNLTYDFGSDRRHGPYLTFPLRQEMANNPDLWRMLDVNIGEVTSPSGANAEVRLEEESGNLLVRVGSEDYTFSGEQTYEINYTIRGLIAPNQEQSGLDEFNWSVVGNAWDAPIRSAKVELRGPADISKTACFSGSSFDKPCEASSEGSAASFSATNIGDGKGMQVTAGFPAGTFVGAEPRYERRYWVGNMFPVTPLTGGVTAVLSALGLAAVIRRSRRSQRDQVYLGLTPGVLPAPGQETSIGRGSAKAPVAVQFSPPQGARPGELGTLIDTTADDRDVTATLVDLAVRGHLKITQPSEKEWTLTRVGEPDQLVGYESILLDHLFCAGPEVTTDDLRDEAYANTTSSTKTALYSRVTKELGWFTANPAIVRVGAFIVGFLLILAGFGVGLALGFVAGWGLVGVAGIITGLAVLVLNKRFGSRTATGSAMLAQTRGFELYLRTAEADQIKFEEGIDVFSRYLPYAIMFGVAERWAKVFADLAAQGHYAFDTTGWYVGYGYGLAFNHAAFSSSMSSLASTMSSSLQHATAASSGGSGFSGGGGFGGGGGGSW